MRSPNDVSIAIAPSILLVFSVAPLLFVMI